jgi:hypothetical protein
MAFEANLFMPQIFKGLEFGLRIAPCWVRKKTVLGWTMVFGLLALTGAGVAAAGPDGLSAMKDASLFFSLLCLISFVSGAMGNRLR